MMLLLLLSLIPFCLGDNVTAATNITFPMNMTCSDLCFRKFIFCNTVEQPSVDNTDDVDKINELFEYCLRVEIVCYDRCMNGTSIFKATDDTISSASTVKIPLLFISILLALSCLK